VSELSLRLSPTGSDLESVQRQETAV